MVNWQCRYVLLAVLALGAPTILTAKELADYRVGDQVTEDIITPVALQVVNPAATDALKEKEAQRLPVVWRYNTAAAAAVEAEVRETFGTARTHFLGLLQSHFQHSRLADAEAQSEDFERILTAFRVQVPGFPMTEEIALQWARGNELLPEQITLLARLRQVMQQPIRPDNLANLPKLGAQVTLINVAGDTDLVSPADVTARGYAVPLTNVVALSHAQQFVADKFVHDDPTLLKYATRLVRANCVVETGLLATARAQLTGGLVAADNYQPGQLIAKKGDTIDPKTMAALTQLLERTMAGRLAQQVAQQKAQAELDRLQAEEIRTKNKSLTRSLLGAGIVIIIGACWLLFRPRRRPVALPGVLSNNATVPLMLGAGDSNISYNTADSWQQRAIAAEEKAERVEEALRAGVLDQFKDKMVDNLVLQRAELIEAQRAAVAEMAEMERRLTELHAPLQDRLRAYENRIADLERALAAKGEENLELIRAKIDLMRKHVAAERAGIPMVFD